MKKIITAALILPLMLLSGCNAEGSGEADITSGGADNANTVNTSEQETTTAAEESTSQEEEKEMTPIKYEIDPSKPIIALTFDDGPNTTTTNEVLDLLEKYRVKASFFLIGNNINDESAATVKRAYDLGCEIDNHSKTHSYMDKMTLENIAEEVKFVSDKVEEITGEPTRFFRPPYIAVNDIMYAAIDMPFICGSGCDDWDSSVTTETRIKRLKRVVKDGTIILLHDAEGNSQTVEALDTLIPYFLEEGFQFATVTELFNARGVEISGEDTNLYTLLAP